MQNDFPEAQMLPLDSNESFLVSFTCVIWFLEEIKYSLQTHRGIIACFNIFNPTEPEDLRRNYAKSL